MKWRIWYADSSSVSSNDCKPAAVPGYGVEVIAQPDRTIGTGNVGYLTITGNWFYFRLDSQNWYAAEAESDVLELLLAREPVIAVCRGRRLPDERFQEILSEAQAWAATHGLPRKSGFRPGERAR